MREFAVTDPRGFLETYPQHVILDEVQRVPDILSYLQTHIDARGASGMYVLTGSCNFGLAADISQSLAGRVAVLELLPFSLMELKRAGKLPETLEEWLFTGAYPRIYDMQLDASQWYANYVMTYLERDMRQVKNVTNLITFQRFLKMCAARSGQVLNVSALGNDCGITHNTARSWISILQAGYIVYLLKPHHRNFNKRLIKSPKLYFYDSGLLCYLLGVASHESLHVHAHRGHIFETWVVSELLKVRLNRGLRDNLYFWRDNVGHEIDCLLDLGEKLLPIEIKSGKTVVKDFFKGLHYYMQVAKDMAEGPVVVYAGAADQRRNGVNVLGWQAFGEQLPDSM